MLPAPATLFNCAFIQGNGSIYQDVGAIDPAVGLSLTVALGQRIDLAIPATDQISLMVGSPTSTSSVTLATAVTGNGLNVPVFGAFADTTITASAATVAPYVGQDLYVLVSTTGPGQLNADNVRLLETAAVPEPTSLGIIGLGAAGLLKRRRRSI